MDTGHSSSGGQMDISDHIKGWHGFLSFVKWLLGFIGIVMIGLAIFRTHG
jgi:hypothetical protein